MKKSIAFTLAETMIALTVIGVLAAILLPSAKNLTANEDVLKFKKAHNTLTTAIRELVTSDKYYLDGDLGVKPNGDLIDGFHEDDYKYFCRTLADVINAKTVVCNDFGWLHSQLATSKRLGQGDVDLGEQSCLNIVNNYCTTGGLVTPSRIISSDGITIYEANPKATFGMPSYMDSQGGRLFEVYGSGGADIDTDSVNYKPICIDIDDPCKGELPFQFGLRTDGKIILSQRTKEWLEKSIHEKD